MDDVGLVAESESGEWKKMGKNEQIKQIEGYMDDMWIYVNEIHILHVPHVLYTLWLFNIAIENGP